jgi:hypothetical protein
LDRTICDGIDYTYHVNNGFKVIDGVVYEYECERCVQTRGMGHWTQSFVNKLYDGRVEDLNTAHKAAVFPYGHLHKVVRISEHE